MYDAWQAQQRAQKDQERRAKTEAAAALQGYRRSGLSEEETKLAALREQERLQKLDAEQQLRGYRSTLTEEEAKLATKRQEELRRKHEYEEQLRKNAVVSSNDSTILMENSGVVSALAAGYSSPNKIQTPMSATKSTPLAHPEFSSSLESDPSSVVSINGITESPVTDDNYNATEEPKPTTTPDPTSVVAPVVAPATATVDGASTSAEALQVATSAVTTSETIESPLASVAPSTNVPSSVQSSVKFMFGILTSGDVSVAFPQNRSELVEGYLARADEIAKSVIVENNSSSSSFESILLSLAYPTASSVKKDESRTDTNRIMVTVTISFSAPDKATSNDFKSQVVERVRSTIAAGTFTKVAR